MTQSRKFLVWTSAVLTSCTLAVFAGCTRGANSSTDTQSTPDLNAPAAPGISLARGGVARSEGVPDAISTEFGLTIPKGFKLNVFADGLVNPRRFAIAPGGTPQNFDVFVSESKANRVRVLRSKNGSGTADEKFVFTDQLSQPYGIAFTKNWVYVGNTDSVVRLPYDAGQTSTDQPPQKIADLTRGGYNQHWTRNLSFSPDGKKLFVTVGSSCNVCEEDDPQRAAISVMNPDGSDRKIFASGLRNPIGLAWRNSNELWAVVNERDRLGDDVPPDYLTRVQAGGFYGWPYAYTDLDRSITPDPNFGSKSPDKVKSTLAPSVPVQAHSAVLGVAFYPDYFLIKTATKNGRPRFDWPNSFPNEYSGDAFLAYHGSWNRSAKTGYKIVRVHFENNKPISVTDFVTGFVKDGRAWGRPVDVQIAPDGSLLFSDDDGGKIWRVSRAG